MICFLIMGLEVLTKYVYLIINNHILRNGFFTAFIIASFCIWLSGFCAGLAVICSYVFGFYVFNFMKKYVNELEYLSSVAVQKYLDYVYPVGCNKLFIFKERGNLDDVDCRSYHDPEIMVSLEVDSSVDKLLNKILDEYVSSWYESISSDNNFRYKISVGLRRAIYTVIQRAVRIDLNTVLATKFIPIYLKHLEEHKQLSSHCETSNLHIAVLNRNSELLYLQNVSKCILDAILPSCGRDCSLYTLLIREILSRWVLLPLSDAVCNPLILDSILLRYLNGNISPSISADKDDASARRVELLRNFVDKSDSKNSNLHPALHQILNDSYLLDTFMYFMKSKNLTHLLQFCVDIDKFNEKLLKPELAADEMDFLYKDAWDIYCIYFSPNSPNCIQFRTDLAPTLRKVLSKDVTKLRTSTALYEAYEYVYSLLETRYCIEFYNSNEYFCWLYGYGDLSTANSKSDVNLSSYENSPVKNSFGKKTMQEISSKLNKIKDVLKSNSVMEGEVYDTECKSAEAYLEEYFEDEDDNDDVDDGDDVSLSSTEERNLNKWRVSISSMGSRSDAVTNKLYTVFVIHVQNEEDSEDHWLVERRPTDFYSLDSKLIEFHGSFQDIQLPPKPRLFKEPLENMQFYERYLNKLLKNPVLKRSELLYSFLKSTEEFEEESGFGRLFRKSVNPNSFKRVKAQYLEPFIQSFVLGNERKLKTSKHNSRESVTIRDPSFCLDTIYGNNFGVHFDISSIARDNTFVNGVRRQNGCNDANIRITPSKSFLYFAIKAYNVPYHVARLLTTLHLLFATIIDTVVDRLITKFFNNIVTSDNVVQIVDIVNWSIFDNKASLNRREIETSLTKALCATSGTLFHPLYVRLHKSWQHPASNKQLYYKLMDALLGELFPELNSSSIEAGT